MRRLPHGGSSRPPFTRPGNGYGRPSARRPGPLFTVEAAPPPESGQFCAPIPVPVLVWEVARNNEPVVAWSEGPTQQVAHRAAFTLTPGARRARAPR